MTAMVSNELAKSAAFTAAPQRTVHAALTDTTVIDTDHAAQILLISTPTNALTTVSVGAFSSSIRL
jgi:hypothetical protein